MIDCPENRSVEKRIHRHIIKGHKSIFQAVSATLPFPAMAQGFHIIITILGDAVFY
jgi:hypothetical protein